MFHVLKCVNEQVKNEAARNVHQEQVIQQIEQ